MKVLGSIDSSMRFIERIYLTIYDVIVDFF